MEQEQYYYNLFMAQQEKRRAAKSAAKRNQILNGQYDQSGGIPRVFWITFGIAVFIILVATSR
jgi:hypothetical protein